MGMGPCRTVMAWHSSVPIHLESLGADETFDCQCFTLPLLWQQLWSRLSSLCRLLVR